MKIDWNKAPITATHVGYYGGFLEFYRPANNENGGEYYDAVDESWEPLLDSFYNLVSRSNVFAKPELEVTMKGGEVQSALIEALELNSGWLRACLDCKDYVWDIDQHEAAQWSYDYAQEVLRKVKQ